MIEYFMINFLLWKIVNLPSKIQPTIFWHKLPELKTSYHDIGKVKKFEFTSCYRIQACDAKTTDIS